MSGIVKASEEFLLMQTAYKTPEATIITLRSYLQEFMLFCAQEKTTAIEQITPSLLRTYQQHLPNKTGRNQLPVKATVLNLYVWAAKKFMEYLYECQLLEEPLHVYLKRAKQPTILPKKVFNLKTSVGFEQEVAPR